MDTLGLTTGFNIQTDSYKGPFELVLELITARKLLVNDLALADITDDFIQHVRAQETFPMIETANFIQVAAMLLLIKSKSLIPDLALTEEEQEDVDDLKHRLEAYERVHEAARELGQIFGVHLMQPSGARPLESIFTPTQDLTSEILSHTLARILSAQKEVEKLPEARVRPMVTIEDMMGQLTKRVQSAMTLSFKDFTGSTKGKVEIVISFLALLELIKNGAVAAEQFDQHGNIRITNTSSSKTPHYG